MSTTITPNMNLPVPVVGDEQGPQYATDINDCMTVIDQHDHTAGSGVLITPAAININTDLPFNGNSLSGLSVLRFQSQISPPTPMSPNLDSLFVSGDDLYYNDGAGNQVRITISGAVNSPTTSIPGLVPPASVFYDSGSETVIWQSDVDVAASTDTRDVILRNNTANSKGLTLTPPTAMAADYSITLPALPLATGLVGMASTGVQAVQSYQVAGDNVGQAMTSTGANAVANSRTRTTGTTVAVGGVALSTSCGAFSTSSSTPVDVTNLTVTITTSGRPIFIGLIGDGTTGSSVIAVSNNSTSISGATGDVFLFNGATNIVNSRFRANVASPTPAFSALQVPVSTFSYIDVQVAGTYTYKIQAQGDSLGSSLNINDSKLIAYEL